MESEGLRSSHADLPPRAISVAARPSPLFSRPSPKLRPRPGLPPRIAGYQLSPVGPSSARVLCRFHQFEGRSRPRSLGQLPTATSPSTYIRFVAPVWLSWCRSTPRYRVHRPVSTRFDRNHPGNAGLIGPVGELRLLLHRPSASGDDDSRSIGRPRPHHVSRVSTTRRQSQNAAPPTAAGSPI